MKRIIILALSVFFLYGCSGDKKKVMSKEEQEEKLAQDQIAMISLNEVDKYPSAPGCPEDISQHVKEKCLRYYITKSYTEALKKYKFLVGEDIKETILVSLKIDSTGKFVYMGSNIREKGIEIFPNLEEILKVETEKMPAITPAEKMGINVNVSCKLPIVVTLGKK